MNSENHTQSDGQGPLTTSVMYLVITTAIWMNKTDDQTNNNRNLPFGVFGVVLPYLTVRSTHFHDLCVRIEFHFSVSNIIFLFVCRLN